ncbi:MAG: class I SAM-dependent methyltransferase [Terriglobia bacterium]
MRFWAPSGLLETYRVWRGGPSGRLFPWRDNYPHLAKVRIEELFPGVDSLVLNIPLNAASGKDEWILPPRELAVLGAICMYCRPQRVFEIGTYKGASTSTIALNTPETTEVFTLDLDPSARDTHKHGLGIGGFPPFEVGSQFRASPARFKIRQLFGNSLTYNYQPFLHRMNLVVVDADHTYEFVRKDTETALALLAPSGIIVWDDYVWNERNPECAGVTRSLNELGRTRKVYQIEGTRLAIYCDRGSAGGSDY